MVSEAMGAGQRFRRHVPPLLFLLALALMIVAVARPAAVVTLPSQHETVILAMDVSGSMRATDVKPNRLVAAQEAAKAFVAEQPQHDAHRHRRRSPARRRSCSRRRRAARTSSPRSTASSCSAAPPIGSGILVSLKTIFPDAEFDLRSSNPRRDAAKRAPARSGRRRADKAAFKPVPPGSYYVARRSSC